MAEITQLSPEDELRFQQWARQNKIADVDRPGSYYDYRGFWKQMGSVPVKFGQDHFPDTYKQHGHPTFSQESKYSKGAFDGGMWLNDDTLLEQPPMAVSHDQALSDIAEFLLKRGR